MRLLGKTLVLSSCLVIFSEPCGTNAKEPALPGKSPQSYEVLSDYKKYIAGSGEVVVWYGQRVALVLDEETSPADRDHLVMAQILESLDAIFEAYDKMTGRRPKLTSPLKGRIRIEVSSKDVGGGLAHHGRLGVGIGGGFFRDLYKRFESGSRTIDQVFFYEIARNYWMPDMNPTIDYHTSLGPQDYGWWTVGFNNAMSVFVPMEIESIDDMYYFGTNGEKFAQSMENHLNIYIENPDKYNWDNSWNAPRLPWSKRTSLNDLMTGLLIRLHRDHGGSAFIRRLYDEIPRRNRLKSRSDTQGARDNFYIASSLAAKKDLYQFFSDELRWEITQRARSEVGNSMKTAINELAGDHQDSE